ncbi:gamma-glutamyl-gamma-aminobutyrate hydrolase family protein [Streptomyces carpaticus]|uniref:gamma-glutamyl-gamma-aminobutyrate hydrolase family protein n=1 Tax=Streptomyces TaxID=1883 RepID=UPI00220AD96F|nr:gamma-glutamyl-gamma-aminobutyrate hydrolase family protein [Streptomyces carpaticus]
MSTPPLIGISTYLEPAARWRDWDLPAALLPAGYHRQVQRAGALAVLLPPDPSPGAAAAAVARLDGLVIAGGPDVAPERYGAARDPRTGPPDPDRDHWELSLIEAAEARRLPLLGICRGMQLLNVARGGTLLQHLDHHAGDVPGRFGSHGIDPVPGTRLAAILDGPLAVPTYHHQAVDRIGTGLTVCAHAPDGTVEAVEDPAAAFTLAVQWHPEMADDTRLMAALVRAAGGG